MSVAIRFQAKTGFAKQAAPRLRGSLSSDDKSGNVSVGVRTRTEIDRIPWQELPHAWQRWAAVDCLPLANDARAWRHGCDLTNMAGGRRYVQWGNPKNVAHVSRRVLNPRLPVCHRHQELHAFRSMTLPRLQKRVRTESRTMGMISLTGPLPDLPAAQLRGIIANQITDLIDLLDALDGDCDLEDGADSEPSIGFTEFGGRVYRTFGQPTHGMIDDLEDDASELEDNGDYEPTLGAGELHVSSFAYHNPSRDRTGDQTHWGYASTVAKQDECEDENEHGGDILDEPHDQLDEGNDELSLGWPEQHSPLRIGTETWGGDSFDTIANTLKFDGSGNAKAHDLISKVPRFSGQINGYSDLLAHDAGSYVGMWKRKV
jgi:hypothetical protein